MIAMTLEVILKSSWFCPNIYFFYFGKVLLCRKSSHSLKCSMFFTLRCPSRTRTFRRCVSLLSRSISSTDTWWTGSSSRRTPLVPVQNCEGSWRAWSESPSGCPSPGCGPRTLLASCRWLPGSRARFCWPTQGVCWLRSLCVTAAQQKTKEAQKERTRCHSLPHCLKVQQKKKEKKIMNEIAVFSNFSQVWFQSSGLSRLPLLTAAFGRWQTVAVPSSSMCSF